MRSPARSANGLSMNRSAVSSSRSSSRAPPRRRRCAARRRRRRAPAAVAIEHVHRRVRDRPADRHRSLTGLDAQTADQIVVSVGPYMFHTSPRPPSSASARSRGAPRRRTAPSGAASPRQPASISMRHVAGVACMTVAPAAAIAAASARRPWPRRRRRCTTRAPGSAARTVSSPEMSNDIVVTASSTSSRVRPGSCRIERRKFASARCSMTTPLGLPVEPDV